MESSAFKSPYDPSMLKVLPSYSKSEPRQDIYILDYIYWYPAMRREAEPILQRHMAPKEHGRKEISRAIPS